jgi:hypothetical protein
LKKLTYSEARKFCDDDNRKETFNNKFLSHKKLLIIGKWLIFGWQNNKWKKEFASGSASTLNNMALSKDGAFAIQRVAIWLRGS